MGGMAEWSIATVLKTVKVKAFRGSNPLTSTTDRCGCTFHRRGRSCLICLVFKVLWRTATCKTGVWDCS